MDRAPAIDDAAAVEIVRRTSSAKSLLPACGQVPHPVRRRRSGTGVLSDRRPLSDGSMLRCAAAVSYYTQVERRELVLAALATGGDWTPVQVQKLFFLVDRRLSPMLGGPFFDFKPYDYGPFDRTVYAEIEALARDGLATVDRPPFGMKTYALTQAGVERGRTLLSAFHPAAQGFLLDLAKWVRERTFAELVSAVYKEYPEMKANSVFREP